MGYNRKRVTKNNFKSFVLNKIPKKKVAGGINTDMQRNRVVIRRRPEFLQTVQIKCR